MAQPTLATARRDLQLAKAALDMARARCTTQDATDAEAHLNACIDAWTALNQTHATA
jgi:hypothetical protein